ncbi:ORF6N domain-containing protein [Bacillus thuringiensis]|uniref:ORF6N domain-containing protein n=1 Tax=Bacillus thuringiensis TaxID=1428 RepID=UPI0038271567
MDQLTVLEFNNERILTTKQLAFIYQTDVNNVQKNFSNHKSKFVEGKHYFFLEGEELRSFKRDLNNIQLVPNNVNQLYLWTERGANRHCKILDTDKAWEQFDYLEETYFNAREQQLPNNLFGQIELIAAGATNLNNRVSKLEHVIEEQLTIDFGQQRVIEKAKGRRIYFLWEHGHIDKEVHGTTRKLFGLLGKNLKDAFDVNSYRDILKKDFDEALKFIEGWRPMI